MFSLGRQFYRSTLYIKLHGLFNAKFMLIEGPWLKYLTHKKINKGIHTFPNIICPLRNIIWWLEFERAYYDVAEQYVTYSTTEIRAEKF